MLRSETVRPYLPPLRLVRPDRRAIAGVVRLGFPIGLTFFLEIGVFSVIGMLIATMGVNAMAAHQIAYNVWDVVYMPLISVGSAMATRVGHAIGAGEMPRVMLAVKTGTAMTLLVGLGSTILLLAIPDLIIGAYTGDAAIHAIAVSLIRLVALFIVIDSVQVAAAFCLRAFKDTRYPFVVMCISYWLLALPLAYWTGMVLTDNPAEGTAAIWGSLIAGICVSSALVSWRLYHKLRSPDWMNDAAPERDRTGS